jgi:hypothetical protein
MSGARADDLAPKAFVNGQWFTGKDFQSRMFYSVNGVLTTQTPPGPVDTIELQGTFVVPPFGDAHNHFPSRKEDLNDGNRAHLEAGVFYTLNPGGDADAANPIRSELGTAETIDTVFAHGVFTCTKGHPQPLLEYFADRGEPVFDKSNLLGHYFYSLDSIDQVDQVWPQFLSTQPDFVKIILGFSEAYRSGAHGSLGMRPDVAKEIVRRARLAGLRSGAHIENAEDFHHAVNIGVDLVMHLPVLPDSMGRKGPCRDDMFKEGRYVIRDADVRLAAERGAGVVTTIATGSAEDFEKPNKFTALTDNEKRFLRITVRNLHRLKDAGVTLVVGSDGQPGSGTLLEVDHLHSSGVFSNLEVLKMWSETTPQAIFPRRRIGKLEESYEASFLALDGNPVEDFAALKKIRMRVKQGHLLQWN